MLPKSADAGCAAAQQSGLDNATDLISAARRLSQSLVRLRFGPPVAFVYNPLDYAWAPHADYLRKYGSGAGRVLFLGMNPGPFGMMQTGVPFGQVAAVRDWLGIEGAVSAPPRFHPARPVTGFSCPRSEVSGERLWGLFAQRFGSPAEFFKQHFVLNYCPLAFLEQTGRNRTPDKLPVPEQATLFRLCDGHLAEVIAILRPQWLIGIGAFAFDRASTLPSADRPKIGRILHPSPASPAANRDWPGVVTRQLQDLGIWS